MEHLTELFNLYTMWEHQKGNSLGALVLHADGSGHLEWLDGTRVACEDYVLRWANFEEGVAILNEVAKLDARQTLRYLATRQQREGNV
jgi:hypothetical protein